MDDSSWFVTELQQKGFDCENSLMTAETNMLLMANYWCPALSGGSINCDPSYGPNSVFGSYNTPENKNKIILKGDYV